MALGYEISNNPKIDKIITTFINEFGPDYRFRGERHNFWELVCVIEGEIQVAADTKIFPLKKGQAILHSPLQFHNISAEGKKNCVIAVFSFEGQNIPEIQNKVCEIYDVSTVKELVRLCEKYYKFRHKVWVYKPIENNNLHLLFIKKLELFLLELAAHFAKENALVTRTAENYANIVRQMQNNIDKRLSVRDLAVICNMSEINLQKTFSHYAGVGVMEYFNFLKMLKAEEYLAGGLSVKETALKLGFYDQNYFSTVFKRIMGRTPSGR